MTTEATGTSVENEWNWFLSGVNPSHDPKETEPVAQNLKYFFVAFVVGIASQTLLCSKISSSATRQGMFVDQVTSMAETFRLLKEAQMPVAYNDVGHFVIRRIDA